MVDIKQLKPGDTVRNIGSGNAYTVTAIDKDTSRVFAVREIEISNPNEWVLIKQPPARVPLVTEQND